MRNRLSAVELNAALLSQLAPLSFSSRVALCLFASCRTLSRQSVKSIVQTLIDYTPEDPSVDQERLTLNMNISGIVHVTNDAANAMLRCYCVDLAKQCAALFMKEVMNGEVDGRVMDASLRIVRLLYTAFMDCNDVVCDAVSALQKVTEVVVLSHEDRKEREGDELYEYIEKSMTMRVKIVPTELRSTMADVLSCVLKCFAKNVGEEIRANVLYDYQYRCVEVNLAFILTMTQGLLKEVSLLKESFLDTVNSAFDRCYEPTEVDGESQKKEIEQGMERFKELVAEK